jgi:hypothetical protein
LADQGIGLDLDADLRRDEATRLDHAGRGPDPAEKLALHLSDLLSVVDVQHEEFGSYHVGGPCPTASSANFTLLKA